MGLVYAEIELIHSGDLELVKQNLKDKDEVRRMHVRMMADSGAWMMAINENIQSILNLPFVEKRIGYMAGGQSQLYDVVGPIMVKFGNRKASCNAYVLPGDSGPLLGAIPMEEMGLLIDPQCQQLLEKPDHYCLFPSITPWPKRSYIPKE